MINLTKCGKPQILVDKADAWTTALVAKLNRGENPTPAEKARYRHPDVKAALVSETNGKCAYCESPLQHIHHGDVEHIYPKSLDPKLTFEWQNLTLSCEVCNQNKSNLDPILAHIIDPYVVDPGDHFQFAGIIAFPLGSTKGISTIKILDLNRGELVEQRKERLEKLLLIVDSALRPGVPPIVRAAIVADLEEQAMAEKSPYSAMGRCFYSSVSAKLAA
jgi:uncharacterized protein (TIGR02646 family)